MRELLSSVDAARIPEKDAQELLKLARLIMRLAQKAAPKFPSIEQAQKVAGVNPDRPVKQRRTRLRID